MLVLIGIIAIVGAIVTARSIARIITHNIYTQTSEKSKVIHATIDRYMNCKHFPLDNYLIFCRLYNLDPNDNENKILDALHWLYNDLTFPVLQTYDTTYKCMLDVSKADQTNISHKFPWMFSDDSNHITDIKKYKQFIHQCMTTLEIYQIKHLQPEYFLRDTCNHMVN